MDNKITKKRLNDMFSYEWIAMLVVIIAVIFVWEVLFGIFSVKLSVGQQFKYFFDYEVDGSGRSPILYAVSENQTFSYDIIKFEAEDLTENDTVLISRLKTQDGDAIFTSTAENQGYVRAKTIIDNTDFTVYDFERLLSDAKDYLRTFLKDEFSGSTADPTVYENLSEEKIENYFLKRMKSDNRYRKKDAKQSGKEQEKARIKKLCREVSDFEYLLGATYGTDIFFRYTRFGQTCEKNPSDSVSANRYAAEVAAGRENAIYGINMEKLVGGRHSSAEYAKLIDKTDAKDVALMVFDFRRYQPDLQYETISFVNTIVRECSDVLSGR